MKELRVEDIHTYYGQSHVLQGLSLTATRGVVTGIVGRNGAGKTTLVRSIVGFTPPRSGRIRLDGKELQARKPEDIAREGIGLVPQGRRIFPSLTVEEHLRIAASTSERDDWNLERVYDLFPALAERTRHRGNQLSGGEQQMLAIARALMTNPQVLIMDEPSEGLAPLVVQDLDRRIRELATTGLTIVLVEQNLPLVLNRADHVYVVAKGQVVYEGDPQTLREDHEQRRTHLGV
jgi:branched-chain amino acid transport system ATP-binding protein